MRRGRGNGGTNTNHHVTMKHSLAARILTLFPWVVCNSYLISTAIHGRVHPHVPCLDHASPKQLRNCNCHHVQAQPPTTKLSKGTDEKDTSTVLHQIIGFFLHRLVTRLPWVYISAVRCSGLSGRFRFQSPWLAPRVGISKNPHE